jgi:hypothetical protein
MAAGGGDAPGTVNAWDSRAIRFAAWTAAQPSGAHTVVGAEGPAPMRGAASASARLKMDDRTPKTGLCNPATPHST